MNHMKESKAQKLSIFDDFKSSSAKARNSSISVCLYYILAIFLCISIKSYNGLLLCSFYALYLLFCDDVYSQLFLVLQIAALGLYLLFCYQSGNSIAARQDDAVYIAIAKHSFHQFSPISIYGLGKESGRLYGLTFDMFYRMNFGYDYLLGIFTRYLFFFAPKDVDYLFINTIPALIIIRTLKKIAHKIYGKKEARLTSKLLIFYPSFIFHSFVVLKDIWAACFLVLFVYSILFSKKILAVLSVFLSVIIRYKTIYLFPLILLVKFKANLLWKNKILFLFLLVICFQLITYFNIVPIGQSSDTLSSYISKEGFTAKIQTATPIIKHIGLFFAWLFAHFPPVHSIIYNFEATNFFYDFASIYWIVLIPFMFLGFYFNHKYISNKIILIVLVLIALSMISSGKVDLRWRLMSDPFALLLISLGMTHKKKYKNFLKHGYFAIIGLISIYLIMKLKSQL